MLSSRPTLERNSAMNKVHRDGVDVGVMFSSGAKRQLGKTLLSNSVDSNQRHVGEPPHPGYVNTPEQRVTKPDFRLKSALRPVARFVYRLVKPAVRPIAFRLRRYFTEGLRQDVVTEFRLVSDTTLHEMQVTRESLRSDALNSPALSLQEFQRVSAATLQEVQAATESLRSDVLNAHGLAIQEFQRMSAATLQEQQATRRSLRSDVLNTHEQSVQEIQRISADTLKKLQALESNLSSRLDRVEQYSFATARRVAINCGQGEVLIKTAVGYVLCSADDHPLLACLIDTGELELGTRLLIQRFLRPGDVFVDVGANIGLHTLAAGGALKGHGKIIAFEPFEPTKRLLEKSVWMNGLSGITEIYQAAVSNMTGHHQLFLGATSGHHSLFPLDTPGDLSSKPVDVPLVRLDGVIFEGQKVDLLKIDVEGAELEVLDSGTSVIMGNPDVALIVEFGPSHLKRTGHSTQQWLEAFTRFELRHQVINSDTGALEDWSLEQLENTESVNLFFARENSQAWVKATT